MRWFRLYDELLDDPKAQQLPPVLFKHWINLMCLASQGNPRGTLPTVGDIAFRLRVEVPKASKVVGDLMEAGLLDYDEEGRLVPHNWRVRQRASDDVAERVRKSRQRNSNGHVTLQATLPETPLKLSRIKETETDTDTEQHPPTPHVPNGAAAADFQPTYPKTLGRNWHAAIGLFRGLTPELTSGAVAAILHDVERSVGPLPAANLREGLEAAQASLKRALEGEGNGGKPISAIRPYATRIIVDRLTEVAHAPAD